MAAIVTCGGLCLGVNNVIRSLVMALHYFYKVKRLVGIPYGYEGLNPETGHDFIELTPDKVKGIHEFGGDGILKGANAIGNKMRKRGLKISVAEIPETIDSDVDIIDKSFGFETSFDVACPIVRGAHNEANGVFNGRAILKLMGRDSGFIAASTALSMPVVNFILPPEMDFQLEGESGFLENFKTLLQLKSTLILLLPMVQANIYMKITAMKKRTHLEIFSIKILVYYFSSGSKRILIAPL
jgi:6-phosphofructokinase 1